MQVSDTESHLQTKKKFPDNRLAHWGVEKNRNFAKGNLTRTPTKTLTVIFDYRV